MLIRLVKRGLILATSDDIRNPPMFSAKTIASTMVLMPRSVDLKGSHFEADPKSAAELGKYFRTLRVRLLSVEPTDA